MVAIPVWLIGKHVTTLSITPQTVASDGTLSDGAVASLVGSVDEVTFTAGVESEEISPMTTTRGNTVIIKNNPRMVLVEILKYNGTNILASASVAADYFKIIFTRGGQTWTGYFNRGEYTETVRRGKSVGTLNLEPVDPGQANPSYA